MFLFNSYIVNNNIIVYITTQASFLPSSPSSSLPSSAPHGASSAQRGQPYLTQGVPSSLVQPLQELASQLLQALGRVFLETTEGLRAQNYYSISSICLPIHPYSITYNSDRAGEPRAGKSGGSSGSGSGRGSSGGSSSSSSSKGRVKGQSSTVKRGGYYKGGGRGSGSGSSSSGSSSSSNSSSSSSVAASTIKRKLLNYLILICQFLQALS